MSGTGIFSGSIILAALLVVAAPALAFDPSQRLQQQQNEGWDEAEAADDAEMPDDEASAAPSPDEEAAVDLCAVAAEREATIDGRRGRVNAIGDVRQTGGGWEVEGVVETGKGLAGLFRDETLFTCFARNGRVESVRIEGGSKG